ncbi:MAG: 5,10-methylenetetrahydrofolate reductase [Actinomycetota bacterium]|nr:5,10-methylenetetrahydrofolate reductase [Actinomycetota bacterium]
MDLRERIAGGLGGFVLFGLTPPRQAMPLEEVQRIADLTLKRLEAIDIDGLVIYDIDDESDRNSGARPFPYLPTMDPADFYTHHLDAWDKPVIVYRSVGKYPQASIRDWLLKQDPQRVLSVFVGAPTRNRSVMTDLRSAQGVWRSTRPELLLGGVAIPERHASNGQEHLRLNAKQVNGCSFFVSQVVYDVNASKDLVSDYFYTCRERAIAPVPFVFTLSVCGSLRTLEFLQWLGVVIPKWMQNDIANSGDTLTTSYEQCLATAEELTQFCLRLGMPFGFNVESVSNRREEIEASVDLAAQLSHQRNKD